MKRFSKLPDTKFSTKYSSLLHTGHLVPFFERFLLSQVEGKWQTLPKELDLRILRVSDRNLFSQYEKGNIIIWVVRKNPS